MFYGCCADHHPDVVWVMWSRSVCCAGVVCRFNRMLYGWCTYAESFVCILDGVEPV